MRILTTSAARLIEWLVRPIPKDVAHELRNFYLVVAGGPAADQAIAKIADVGRHCFCYLFHYCLVYLCFFEPLFWIQGELQHTRAIPVRR